jgi:hypothetical protein
MQYGPINYTKKINMIEKDEQFTYLHRVIVRSDSGTWTKTPLVLQKTTYASVLIA